jgi:phosphopantetheinyl transferase
LREDRERSEERERDRRERHQRQHRRERQTASHLRDAILAAALRGEFRETLERVEIETQPGQQDNLLRLSTSIHAPACA